jgi:hypothetical protein
MVEISSKPSDFFMVEQFSIHTFRCFLKCLAIIPNQWPQMHLRWPSNSDPVCLRATTLAGSMADHGRSSLPTGGEVSAHSLKSRQGVALDHKQAPDRRGSRTGSKESKQAYVCEWGTLNTQNQPSQNRGPNLKFLQYLVRYITPITFLLSPLFYSPSTLTLTLPLLLHHSYSYTSYLPIFTLPTLSPHHSNPSSC